METIPVEKGGDVLLRAYEIIRKGAANDSLTASVRRYLWQRIQARCLVDDWSGKRATDKSFQLAMLQALPDDPVLLEEIRTMASEKADRDPSFSTAFLIIGAINERLQKCQPSGLGFLKNNRLDFKLARTAQAADTAPGYSGFVCAEVRRLEAGGAIISAGEIRGGKQYRLAVWMQPEPGESGWSDDVVVGSGTGDGFVAFDFEVDCATLSIPFGRKRQYFHRRARSGEVYFDFFTPAKSGRHLIWVHVQQERRLVKSLVVELRVGADSHGPAQNRNSRRRKKPVS